MLSKEERARLRELIAKRGDWEVVNSQMIAARDALPALLDAADERDRLAELLYEAKQEFDPCCHRLYPVNCSCNLCKQIDVALAGREGQD